MQRREAPHRESNDVCALDMQMCKNIANVIACPRLGVPCRIWGHVRWRVPPGVERDAAEPTRQEAHLWFPTAMISSELVNQHNRNARTRLFAIEPHAVTCHGSAAK